MADFSPRFSTPVNAPRPRGKRLLTAFSPKLDRTIQAFDYLGLEQWIRLETDPRVISFCERPAFIDATGKGRLIDFWVQHRDGEEMLVIDRAGGADATPQTASGVALRVVPPAELVAARTWIANWLRMIPTINATRKLLTKTLLESAVAVLRSPMPLGQLEHELSTGDPSVVRGALFELLRTGRLTAPSLHTHTLSLNTIVEPAP